MPAPDRPILADLQRQFAGLAADAREMLSQRVELARLELESDARAAKRLLAAMGAAGVLALSVLPVLTVALAEALDGSVGIARWGWLILLAAAELGAAAAVAVPAWRRFRRDLAALRQTREELHEDLVWLGEWSRREQSAE